MSPLFVYIISLGCAKNLVDTEVMCGSLATHNFALTDDPDMADIMLVNTCSFVAEARLESESEIRQALDWKQKETNRRVLVAGCLPQRYSERIRLQFPDVDLLISLDEVAHIGTILQELDSGAPKREVDFTASQYIYDHETPRLQLTPSTYAYVKIAEGCDHRCRFCSIPDIRGMQRSRSVASIVAECENLLARDVRELNFVAQDTTRYGSDRPDEANLASLLQACDSLSGDFWIRVLYTHPRYFQHNLIDVMKDCEHVVPYIDMPLQHISNQMLLKMGRGMGELETMELLNAFREHWPQAAIRTTFLVGHPGETEQDFEQLLRFVTEFRFERLGVFIFSPEEGTPSAAMTEGLVPVETARERRDAILQRQQEIAWTENRKLIGQTVRALVDHWENDKTCIARTESDAPDVDNLVHVMLSNEADKQLDFIEVQIEDAEPYDLYGQLSE